MFVMYSHSQSISKNNNKNNIYFLSRFEAALLQATLNNWESVEIQSVPTGKEGHAESPSVIHHAEGQLLNL